MTIYTFPTVPESYVVNDIVQFNYSGNVQTFSLLNATRIKIELWGAQGGNGGNTPGLGGYVFGEYLSSSGTTLNFYIGGIGGNTSDNLTGTPITTAGYNGGGEGGPGQSGNDIHRGPGGGGATDIRLSGTSLSDRILIAGGGGGSGSRNVQVTGWAGGGAGGGGGFMSQNGNPGYTASARGFGNGGTQVSGGSGGASNSGGSTAGTSGTLGVGGTGGTDAMSLPQFNYTGPGGGGGYYGGGGGGAGGIDGRGTGGAGGGSGYINTTLISKYGGESGERVGNGLAIVTIIEI